MDPRLVVVAVVSDVPSVSSRLRVNASGSRKIRRPKSCGLFCAALSRRRTMKRMRDYSKWPLPRLQIQAQHHGDVIARLSAKGFPCGFNRLVLAESEKQIAAK
jgi:hypothetical protein